MTGDPLPPIPYPPIERHGVIGDRRSAALVAADGTVDWLCLPDYSGGVVFGAILDHTVGGYWKLGPALPLLGTQTYREDTATVVTAWSAGGWRLELADAMGVPEDKAEDETKARRFLVRHLRCTRGRVPCVLDFRPRWNFAAGSWKKTPAGDVSSPDRRAHLKLWTSQDVARDADGSRAVFELGRGEECWAVLEISGENVDWSVKRAQEAVTQAERYWMSWMKSVRYSGPRRNVRRSALLVHLLSYGPAGSAVAAPTTSLPERIGGHWNADYRFAWVRDTSLTLAVLSLMGNTEDGDKYLGWLSHLDSSTDAPYQVMYGVRGETKMPQKAWKELYGYRGSCPVRFGNHAFDQHQHDSAGYLADCALIHLEQGGKWQPEFWKVVRRIADFTADHWREPGNSIWELPVEQHYLSGKVMAWVALDRAIKIAERLGHSKGVRGWRSVRAKVYAEVMEKGWSDRLGAFRQRYEADNLDAAALLIPVMNFLPANDPRVQSTVERIAERLTINGFVYRFNPPETPGAGDISMGEYEGAFLPCTFWLATAYAKAGRVRLARTILERAEAIAGPLGLFAEGVDARSSSFLGNTPLLFSHSEYVRAALELEKINHTASNGQ